MFDPERMLGQMLGGALGGALGGKTHDRRQRRGSNGLMGAAGKAQLGIGLLGIAMAAWEHYSQNQSARAAGSAAPMPPPPPSPAQAFAAPPPPPAAMMPPAAATSPAPMLDLRRQQAMLLIRTMIAAAAADGAIDDNERAAVLERARGLGDDPQALQFLQAELSAPVSAEDLVAQTPRSLANEVYAAAVLAIDIDTEHERAWLDRLAGGLGLAPELRQQLHQQLGLA